MSLNKQIYLIPEEIPANERTAFHGAAAGAAKAGKKTFKFNGKTHPVTMKKDTAKAITSQNETSHDDAEMDPEDKKEKLKKKNGKSMKGDTAEMNPKMGDKKGAPMEQKESLSIRDKLMIVLEGDRAKHYKGATRPETDDDKLSGAGAKKMKADIQGNAADPDLVSKAHDDASKAGKVTKPAKKRATDNDQGDKKIINEPEDITKKGKGNEAMKTESRNGLAATLEAYASMYEALKYVTQDKTGPLTKSIDVIDRELSKLEKYGLKDEGQDDKETKKLTASATKEYQKQVKKLARALDDVRSSIY